MPFSEKMEAFYCFDIAWASQPDLQAFGSWYDGEMFWCSEHTLLWKTTSYIYAAFMLCTPLWCRVRLLNDHTHECILLLLLDCLRKSIIWDHLTNVRIDFDSRLLYNTTWECVPISSLLMRRPQGNHCQENPFPRILPKWQTVKTRSYNLKMSPYFHWEVL